jgi:hypothetical protein
MLQDILIALGSDSINYEVWSERIGNSQPPEYNYYGKTASWYYGNWVSSAEETIYNRLKDRYQHWWPRPVQRPLPPARELRLLDDTYQLNRTPEFQAVQDENDRDLYQFGQFFSMVPGGQPLALIPIAMDIRDGNHGTAALTAITAGVGGYLSVGDAALSVRTLTARLSQHTRSAVSFVDASESNLLSLLSPARQAQYLRGEMQPALRGIAVETRARALIAQDTELMQYITLGARSRGPDIVLQSGGHWWDITTPENWAAHLARPASNGYTGTGHLLSTAP